MGDRCDCGSKVGEPHLPACHYTGIVTGNERYNVADMKGNSIPDSVVEGVTQRGNWDLRDEDGHLHSPSWYLDAFLVTRDAYGAALDNPRSDGEHLDHLQAEHDKYATYVNRMFGSEMVEGVWNGPKDE